MSRVGPSGPGGMLGPSRPEPSGHAGLRPQQPRRGSRVRSRPTHADTFPHVQHWCQRDCAYVATWPHFCPMVYICSNSLLCFAALTVTSHFLFVFRWCKYFSCFFLARVQSLPSISALKFNGSLTMAVGTSTGQVSANWVFTWTPVLLGCLSQRSVTCCELSQRSGRQIQILAPLWFFTCYVMVNLKNGAYFLVAPVLLVIKCLNSRGVEFETIRLFVLHTFRSPSSHPALLLCLVGAALWPARQPAAAGQRPQLQPANQVTQLPRPAGPGCVRWRKNHKDVE